MKMKNRFALISSEGFCCSVAPGLLVGQQQESPAAVGVCGAEDVCQAKTEILLNTCSPHSYLVCIKRSWLPSLRRGKWIMC